MQILGGVKLEGMPYYRQDKFWGSPFNYLEDIRSCFPDNVYIHDVTLRDGEQTPGIFYKEDERVHIAEALDSLGVGKIEVGMPVISARVAQAMKKIAGLNLKAELVGLARANKDDVHAVMDCGLSSIIIEFPMNPYLAQYAYGADVEKNIDKVSSVIAYAKEHGLKTAYEPWDCWRATPDLMKTILSGVISQARPDVVIMTDTFAVAIPKAIEYTFRKLRKWFPDTILEFHTHNDFGLGTAQALSAIAGGANGVHSGFNGIGERSGNVPTEEIVCALEILLGVKTGVDLSKLTMISRVVEEITKYRIASRKAIVGRKLFEVESGVGIHFIGRLREKGINPIYPFSPEIVGGAPIRFVLGKGSGRASIRQFLHKVALSATDEQVDEILRRVKHTSQVCKDLVSEETFYRIAYDVTGSYGNEGQDNRK
jgi:isopropylmalate/homocitrate/citramalate synthase